ncbi:MAG TPA: hypothetical protein VGC42_26865 [Kofleriaceae bacterium]
MRRLFVIVLASSAAQAQPAPHRLPFTVEAGLGIGTVRVPGSFETTRFDTPLLGVHAGAAAWLTPHLALGALFSGAGYDHAAADDRSNYRHGFVGSSAQYWLTDWLWLSGDAGLGLLDRKQYGHAYQLHRGLAFDLRAGRSFAVGGPSHQLEVALDVMPSHYTIDGAIRNYQVVLVTLGYQLL